MLLWKTLFVRKWYLGILLVGVLGALLYVLLDLAAASANTDQFLRRQQTLARAQASNTASFFEVFGESIVVLAKLHSIKNQDSDAIKDLDSFVEQWRGSSLVGGVVLTNATGKVTLNSNVLGTRDVGASLSDRDYFVWALSQGSPDEYFVGTPVVSRLGATKGQVIIPVAAKVYRNGTFMGLVIASVRLQPLMARYLELMKVSESSTVYLTDSGGKLLYSSDTLSFETDSNIIDRLPSLKGKLSPKEEARAKIDNDLIAQSPVSLGDQNWILIIDSPASEVTEFTQPVRIRQTGLILLTFLTVLTLIEFHSRGLLPFQKRL